jgi:hypothetical protein
MLLLKYASYMARHPQSDQKAVSASEILSDSRSLPGDTLGHARLLQKAQHVLAESVDPALATRFQVANIRQNRLILLAPAAAWATRLRMETPRLLETLHKAGFAGLREIDVRVAPLVEEPAKKRSPKALSPAARQALGCMARLGAKSEE